MARHVPGFVLDPSKLLGPVVNQGAPAPCFLPLPPTKKAQFPSSILITPFPSLFLPCLYYMNYLLNHAMHLTEYWPTINFQQNASIAQLPFQITQDKDLFYYHFYFILCF